MANTRVLVRRRKSVRNTRKITKTMEKISTAKLAKSQNAAIAARPYSQKLKEIIGEVAKASGGVQHPLLEAREKPKKAVVIVLTADRGLCGGFNANIIKAAKGLIAELKEKNRELEFIVQGKKGIGAFKYMNIPIAERLIGISDKPTYARAEQIAQKLIDQYSRKEIDEVYLVYSAFKSAASQAPKAEKIMPLSGLEGEKADGAKKSAAPVKDAKPQAEGMGYIFHPDPKTILTQVLPLVVKMALFTAMLESTASEHAARRVAMKNATDSAGRHDQVPEPRIQSRAAEQDHAGNRRNRRGRMRCNYVIKERKQVPDNEQTLLRLYIDARYLQWLRVRRGRA